jgi:hypothetical protein
MTLRIDLAGTAIAALVLILTGVATAHAAVQTSDDRVREEPLGYRMPDSTGTPRTRLAQSGNCIGGPWRCHYNANGRLYFGAHPRDPNRASWGCGATDGKVRGRSWNYASRTAASYRALAECSRKTAQGRCHIVSCRPGVHNSFEAIAIWGANTQQ